MSLIKLSNGERLDFPRRLFEAFVKFSYDENAVFAAEIERIYVVNGQIIYVNELPKDLHFDLVEMLGLFMDAIAEVGTLTDVNAANRLLRAFLDNLRRFRQA